MAKNVAIVLVGAYVLGFFGAFVASIVENRDLGTMQHIFTQALLTGLSWPYEFYRLIF